MELIIPELSLVDIVVGHDQLSMDPLVVSPFSFKPAAVWPSHGSLAVPLVSLLLSIKSCLLIVHNDVVILVEDHRPLATSLSVLEHPYVLVSTGIIRLAIAAEPTFFKPSAQLMRLALP